MPYSVKSKKNGTEYFLHSALAANGKTPIYFFRKTETEGGQDKMPDGYEVSENPRTGLPILKKTAKS